MEKTVSSGQSSNKSDTQKLKSRLALKTNELSHLKRQNEDLLEKIKILRENEVLDYKAQSEQLATMARLSEVSSERDNLQKMVKYYDKALKILMSFLSDSNAQLSEELKAVRPDFGYSIRNKKNIFSKDDDSMPRLKEDYKGCLQKLKSLESNLKKRISFERNSLQTPQKKNLFSSKQVKSEEVKDFNPNQIDFSKLQQQAEDINQFEAILDDAKSTVSRRSDVHRLSRKVNAEEIIRISQRKERTASFVNRNESLGQNSTS